MTRSHWYYIAIILLSIYGFYIIANQAFFSDLNIADISELENMPEFASMPEPMKEQMIEQFLIMSESFQQTAFIVSVNNSVGIFILIGFLVFAKKRNLRRVEVIGSFFYIYSVSYFIGSSLQIFSLSQNPLSIMSTIFAQNILFAIFAFVPLTYIIIFTIYLFFRYKKIKDVMEQITYKLPKKVIKSSLHHKGKPVTTVGLFFIFSIAINLSGTYLMLTIPAVELFDLIPFADSVSELLPALDKTLEEDFKVSDHPTFLYLSISIGPLIMLFLRLNRRKEIKSGIEKFRGARILLIYFYFTLIIIGVNSFPIENDVSADESTSPSSMESFENFFIFQAIIITSIFGGLVMIVVVLLIDRLIISKLWENY